jgi:hypothetical protein
MRAIAEGREETLDGAVARLRQATEDALGPQPQDDWTFIVAERMPERTLSTRRRR